MAFFSKPPAPALAANLPFLPVTSLAAAFLALLSVRLAVLVIRVRRSTKIPYQSEDREFVKRQRAHANLSEYAPLFCVMCALIEAGPAPLSAAALPLALLFCAGRAFHAASMGFDADFPWRVRGTGCTLLAFMGGAAVLVARTGLGLVAAARARA